MKAHRVSKKIRATRGSSYLTHGSDTYDHRAYKKALRVQGAFEIEDQLAGEEVPSELCTSKGTTFRIVLMSQVYENYGAWHNPPVQYWKAKGGHEYHRNIGTADEVISLGRDGIHQIALEMSQKILRHCEEFQESAIGWEIVPSTEETHDERMYREMLEEGYPDYGSPVREIYSLTSACHRFLREAASGPEESVKHWDFPED